MIASNFNTSKFTGLQSTLATLTSGVIAGIAAAILSHPADTLLSKINGGRDSQGLLPGGEGSNMKRLLVLAKETGFSGLWNGLMPRIFMTCFLVSGQFLLYSHIKKALNAPAGIDIHKN